MKSILGPGITAGLILVCALSAIAQTDSATSHASNLATPAQGAAANNYQYDFIANRYVWSNKPLKATAGKICQTMKDHAFNETAYAINGDQDWNACLDTQIRSIGYLRWLRNGGFKPTRKNRRNTQDYLKKNYTMGRWGGYTFAELSQAVKATTGKQIP